MSNGVDTVSQTLDTEDTIANLTAQADKDGAIANLQAALAAVHQERDRWEAKARELTDTLAARETDLSEARETIASLQAELEIVRCDSEALLQADRESWLADAKQDEANLEASKADLQQARQALTEKDGAIANRQTELAAVHQERDKWETKARETETTLEATRADFQKARDAIATLQGELLEAQAALVRAEELKQQPVALVSESQSQTFKPGWVRVTAKRAAEIVTNESSQLDPKPVTVAKLNNMSGKMLEQYNLRRVRAGIQTIYEFYQRTVPISPEK